MFSTYFINLNLQFSMTARKEFIKSLDQDTRTGKIDIRLKVLELFDKAYTPYNAQRQFKVITLSSLHWIFEKTLLSYLQTKWKGVPDKRSITLKSFEYDWKVFCAASVQIPSGFHAKIEQEISPLNYQVVKSSYGRHLVSVHHIDVFDYLKSTDNLFDFLWLDLVSPIDFVQDKLASIPLRMHPDSHLILSFPKGRERIKIKDRIEHVKELLPDLIYLETIEYFDTTPMMNMVFISPKAEMPKEQFILQ